MKICPNCQSRYTDDTLQYCLQDGSPLVFETENPPPAPTVAYSGETETIVNKRRADEAENLQAETRGTNTALIVAATALATVLIFGAAAVGAWLYFSKDETARNANVKSSFPENANKTSNFNSTASPSSGASETPSEEKAATPAPTPQVDPEKIKAEVSGVVNDWKSLAESRNLSAYMNKYAGTVDYYNKKGATAAAVRADKQRAFSIYDTIEINLSNMRVNPDASGDGATAVFDKEWYFESDTKTSEGKVRTELRLKKIGGEWKITGERDLKVYYVN